MRHLTLAGYIATERPRTVNCFAGGFELLDELVGATGRVDDHFGL